MLLRQAGLVRQFSLARKSLLGSVGAAVIAVAATVSAVAERTALAVTSEMGHGAWVRQARLMNVAAASRAAGQGVASYYTGASRQVWLVWIGGPWRMLRCITATACPLKLNQVYCDAIDARTGFDYGLGWERAYQHQVTPSHR
jgi:hypothetical protein